MARKEVPGLMLQLWRITFRHLSYVISDRHVFTKTIAIKSHNEKEAVSFMASWGSPIWRQENIIVDVVHIGELCKAEGFEVPEEED